MRNLLIPWICCLVLLSGVSFADNEQQETDAFKAAVAAWESGAELTYQQMNLLRPYVPPPGYVIDESTNPDAFGYHVIDSDEPNGPAFNWIDITQTGTEVAAGLMLGDEDKIGPFPIGFSFPFYGETYDQFWIQSNGVISFFSTYVLSLNQPIPTATFGEMIAWFWDDLDPDNGVDGGHVYYETRDIGGSPALIVSFVEIDEYPDGPDQDNVTAQVILNEDGDIMIQYQHIDVLMDTQSCSVGIQNSDGTIGTSYLYNGTPSDLLHDNLALLFEVLPAEFSLTGLVLNANTEDPIPLALVQSGNLNALTDEYGEFMLGQFVPGQIIDVYVRADGYFSQTLEVQLNEDLTFEEFDLAPFGRPLKVNYLSTMEINQGRLEVDEDLYPNWEFGEPTTEPGSAHSGSNAWGSRIDRDYLPNARDWLVSRQSFKIMEPGAKLQYWHWYNIESLFDGYNVHISMDGGETWELLIPDGGYSDLTGIFVNGWQPCFNNGGGDAGQWNQVVFNLNDYVGEQVWFGFYLTTDPFANRPGVTIDDIEVYVEAPDEQIEMFAESTQRIYPEDGGQVQFSVSANSYFTTAHTGDMWSQLRTPNGHDSNVLTNFNGVIDPGLNTYPFQSFELPGNAPGGLYTLYVFAGTYPDNPISTAYYQFSKQLDSNGDIPIPPPEGGGGFDQDTDLRIHPNPLNMAATVTVQVPDDGLVRIQLYNLLGREVLRVAEANVRSGAHSFNFDASNLATGVYFMQAWLPDGSSQIQKVVLLK